MLRFATVALVSCVLVSCAEFDKITNVVYDDRFEATALDVYLPGEVAPDSPAVMLIHGGGWSRGSRSDYDGHARRLAHAGYVVATIDYRLAPEGAYPLLVQDVFCAFAFLQANAAQYSIDPTRIAVSGFSAGGHLAALVATADAVDELAPDCGVVPFAKPAAAISIAGPSDLRRAPEHLSNVAFATEDFLGGSIDEVPDVYERASPIVHVSADDPPFLHIHGGADSFINFEQTRLMDSALEDAAVASQVLRLRGTGHIINLGGDQVDITYPVAPDDAPETWAVMLDFLDEELR